MSKIKKKGKNNGGIFRVKEDLFNRILDMITEEEKNTKEMRFLLGDKYYILRMKDMRR